MLLIATAVSLLMLAAADDYTDLDSFLSDLPHQAPAFGSETTLAPTTTLEPPPPQCYRTDKPMVFPPSLFSNKSSHYPFLESGLQIFLGLKLPCDGVISAWQFLSAHSVIWGLHFGVFRRTCFDVFQLVSDTYINGQTTGSADEKWVAWKPAAPIPVKRGDVIGLFYDRVQSGTKTVTVRSVTLPDHYRYAPKQFARAETLVFLSDAQRLAETQGCVRLANGRVTKRIPALFLLMTPKIRGKLVTSESRLIGGETTPASSNVKTSSKKKGTKVAASNLKSVGVPAGCTELPKFDYSCTIALSVRYYFDQISKVCRQFLYCPENEEASAFGFATQASCLSECSAALEQKVEAPTFSQTSRGSRRSARRRGGAEGKVLRRKTTTATISKKKKKSMPEPIEVKPQTAGEVLRNPVQVPADEQERSIPFTLASAPGVPKYHRGFYGNGVVTPRRLSRRMRRH